LIEKALRQQFKPSADDIIWYLRVWAVLMGGESIGLFVLLITEIEDGKMQRF
jgi:hypothetical protein